MSGPARFSARGSVFITSIHEAQSVRLPRRFVRDRVQRRPARGAHFCVVRLSFETTKAHLEQGLQQTTAPVWRLCESANRLLTNLNLTVKRLKVDLDQFTPKLGPLADWLKLVVEILQNVLKNLAGMSKDTDKVLVTA